MDPEKRLKMSKKIFGKDLVPVCLPLYAEVLPIYAENRPYFLVLKNVIFCLPRDLDMLLKVGPKKTLKKL